MTNGAETREKIAAWRGNHPVAARLVAWLLLAGILALAGWGIYRAALQIAEGKWLKVAVMAMGIGLASWRSCQKRAKSPVAK